MTVRVVVPISGGKDSQACLALAVSHFSKNEILGLFCDTQFEHPATYAHVDFMRSYYGVRIESLSAGSVLDKVKKYGRFPGGGARHCTDELKIQVTKKWAKMFATGQGRFELWYGVRTSESPERRKRYAGKVSDELYAPHEFMPSKYPKYLSALGVRIRLPIVEWSTPDVLSYLGGLEHPHYAQGFDRVGCFPCLAAGDKHKARAFGFDDFGRQQRRKVIAIEKEIGRSVWTSKSGEALYGAPPCALCTY